MADLTDVVALKPYQNYLCHCGDCKFEWREVMHRAKRDICCPNCGETLEIEDRNASPAS